MCDCVDVEVGSYANQVMLPRPGHMIGRKEGSASDSICVDRCLAEEIEALWALGIATTGCCCGHNKLMPYIGVIEEHISWMKQLGYAVMPNPNRPGDEDSFFPQSIPFPDAQGRL